MQLTKSHPLYKIFNPEKDPETGLVRTNIDYSSRLRPIRVLRQTLSVQTSSRRRRRSILPTGTVRKRWLLWWRACGLMAPPLSQR